jgi:hypothetical protein
MAINFHGAVSRFNLSEEADFVPAENLTRNARDVCARFIGAERRWRARKLCGYRTGWRGDENA